MFLVFLFWKYVWGEKRTFSLFYAGQEALRSQWANAIVGWKQIFFYFLRRLKPWAPIASLWWDE